MKSSSSRASRESLEGLKRTRESERQESEDTDGCSSAALTTSLLLESQDDTSGSSGCPFWCSLAAFSS